MTQLPRGNHSFKTHLLQTCLVFVLLLHLPTPTVHALESIFSTGSDWNAGTGLRTDNTIKDGDISIEASGSWGAQSWRTPDLALSIGSSFVSDGNNIYVTRGVGDVVFWKYSTVDDAWTVLANLPRGTYYGADLEILGEYIYAVFGGYQKTFARYSIANNTWELLQDFPDLTYSGTSLTSDGTNLYALRGNTTQEFYKYTVATNTWSALTGPPATIRGGADLVRVGNYLYTPRGLNTVTFYRYDLTANTWSTLANLPAAVSEDVDISTNGTHIFVSRQTNTTAFYSYNIAANTWSTLAPHPVVSRYTGAIYNAGDGYVYVFQGNGGFSFWKYDIGSNTYLGPSDAPSTLSTGSDMVFSGDSLYVPRGTNTTTMYRFNTSSGAWTTVAAAPAAFNDDTKGVAAGANIYFFRGSNTLTFYRYNPSGNTWTTMADAPAAIRFGGTLAYPGSGDYLYATRGAATLTFMRYSITNNTWDDLGAADLPVDAESSYGSRLISDGTDIYYLAGTGISRWFKYTIATNTWSELTRAPFAPYYGTDLSYYDGKIIALAGWYKTDVWEYLIAENLWRKIQPMPGVLPQNMGAYAGSSIEYNGSGTFYISRANGRAQLATYSPGATNYSSTGLWTSAPRDLGAVTSWNSLTSTQSTPSDSSITFQTRTSSDNTSWSDWETVVTNTIASPAQRFIQVKATLIANTGESETPTLQDITISYVGDTAEPSNTLTVSGVSQTAGGIELESEETYKFNNPHFSWTGATDSQSTVAGYYVYFGTNELADPTVVGEFQTLSTYTVTKPLSTGTYYLRIATKDSAENISDPDTFFIYDYSGISPPQSLFVGEQLDFSGTTSGTAISSGSIKLESRAGGFWMQEPLSSPPGSIQYGGKNIAYVSESEQLYVLRGNNSANFYSYAITTDTWSTLANAPGNVRMGGGVIEGPEGFLYGFQGNNSTAFWRYSIEDNLWSNEDAADAPLTVYYGGSLVFDGTQYIYALRGNNDDAFWRYNTAEDTWETLANADFGATGQAINNNVYTSGDLAIDQEEELIYATQGNYLDGFSVYDINTNAWTVLPDVPALPNIGSSIEYVPEESAVYFMPGNSSDRLFRYDTNEETWEEVAPAPVIVNYGATIRQAGDYLFALQGNNTTGFFKYHIGKNSWQTANRGLFGRVFEGTSILNQQYGADILKGDGDNFYIMRGNFSDEFVRWNSATGVSTHMTATPVGTTSGSSLVYDSTANKIYLTGGNMVQKFYVYDVATDTWDEEASDPPLANTDYGSSMVYDGSRYI